METEVCKDCGIEKPLSEYKSSIVNNKTYYRKICHKCELEKRREHYKNVLSQDEEYKAKARARARKYEKEHQDELREKRRDYRREYNKKYHEEHKEYYQDYKKTEKYKEQQKQYKQKNHDIIAEKNKKYKEENHDIILEKRKKHDKTYRLNHLEQIKQWRQDNIDIIRRERRDYHNKRVVSDPLYKFEKQIRGVITSSFKRKGYKKTSRTYEIIGIEFKELNEYLLNTFKNNYGYDWDGIEEVHIDHIIPLATATSEEDIIKLCYYTNLQLLKSKDNLEKSDKLDWNIKTK